MKRMNYKKRILALLCCLTMFTANILPPIGSVVKASSDTTEWSIPFTMTETITGQGTSTPIVLSQKTFDAIDVSAYDASSLMLVMDIEITNNTNPGKMPNGMFTDGQIELSSSGTSDKNEISKNVADLAWRYGKKEYSYSLANCGGAGGSIDYSAINYMRIYLMSWEGSFTDTITITVTNVRIVVNTDTKLLPTIFSDGMLFQQNKPMKVWGYGTAKDEVAAELYKGDELIETKTATVTEDGRWDIAFTAREGSYDSYKMKVAVGNEECTINDILIGELWIAAGQSNMELMVGLDLDSEEIIESASDENSQYVRFYLEPSSPSGTQSADPEKDILDAYWTYGNRAEEVYYTSALAYTFARNLQKTLDVPVGYIDCALGATMIEAWLPREAIENDADVKAALQERGLYYSKDNWSTSIATMSNLYNRKVGPLAGMNIAGVIWYQGESNNGHSEIYDIELNLLKRSWSKAFGFENEDMPLIFTQVAPYYYTNKNRNGYLSMFMEKGWRLSADKNTAMLALYDLSLEHMKDGSTSDPIHPRKKTEVAERFYQSAMNMVYGGINGVKEEYTAPVYESMEIKNGAVYITFDRVGNYGLTTTDGSENLHGFTIAGQNGIYVNAQAEIIKNPDGTPSDTIKVWNDTISDPKNVIYAFDNLNQGANLCNSAGIPASPFRTLQVDDKATAQSSEITYFVAQDWMYADKDVWVHDPTNTENYSVGYRPSFNVTGGTYAYDNQVKEEGIASLKVNYDGDFEVSPILTYESISQNWNKFDYLTVSMLNAEDAEVTMVITSDGIEYTIPTTEGAASAVLSGTQSGFTVVTYDMTQISDDVLSSFTKVAFRITTGNTSGVMYFDNFLFGLSDTKTVKNKWSIIDERTEAGAVQVWVKNGLELNLNKTSADESNLTLYMTFTLTDAAYNNLKSGASFRVDIGQTDSKSYQWFFANVSTTLQPGENTLALSFAEANIKDADLSKTLNQVRMYCWNSAWSDLLYLNGMVIKEMKIVDVSPYVQEYASGEAGKTPEELGLSTENVPEGYLFAGWYKDAECTTENTLTGKSNSTVYAKFVRQDVLDLKAQYVTETVTKGSQKWHLLSEATAAGEVQTWVKNDLELNLNKTSADESNLTLHVTFTLTEVAYNNLKSSPRFCVDIGQTDAKSYQWFFENVSTTLQPGKNTLTMSFGTAHVKDADLSDTLSQVRMYCYNSAWSGLVNLNGLVINEMKVVYTPAGAVHSIVSEATAVGETITWTKACNVNLKRTAADAENIVLHVTFNVSAAAYNNMKPGVRLGIGIGQRADSAEYLWYLDSYLANELQVGDNTLVLSFASANVKSADLSAALTTVRMFYWMSGWSGVGNLSGVTIKEMKVEDNTGKYDNLGAIRFVTTVDSLQYQSVGFDITIGNTTKEVKSTYVYRTLYAIGSTHETISYKPTDIDAASKFFTTYTIDAIPEDSWDTVITVQPFWITQDGTKVTGTVKKYTINAMMN